MPEVIVDDRDADNITYTGPWNHNTGVYQEFMKGTSQSFNNGASFAISFEGTSISVYGTIGFGDASSCTFSLDGGAPTAFSTNVTTAPLFHQNFYSSPTSLSSGSHTLTMTYTNTSTNSNLFWDYILYASPSSTGVSGDFIFFDDSDSTLQYSGLWGTGDASDQNLQSTLHTATTSGASVKLSFEGSSYQVFGQLSNVNGTGSLATASLDGGTGIQASFPSNSNPPSGQSFTANYVLFPSTVVSPGNHTLEITAGADNALYLDYIIVGIMPNSTSGASPSSSSGSSSGGGSSSSHSNAGAIAGGVVGGVVALAAIGALVWFLLRRRHPVEKVQPDPFYQAPLSEPATLHPPPGSYYSSTQLSPNRYIPGGTQPSYSQPSQSQFGSSNPYPASTSNYTSSNSRSAANAITPYGTDPQPNPSVPHVHSDSGVRGLSDDEPLPVELPPHYTRD